MGSRISDCVARACNRAVYEAVSTMSNQSQHGKSYLKANNLIKNQVFIFRASAFFFKRR